MTMLAFKDTEVSKSAVLERIIAHQKADEIVQGQYWQNGKGCAVGCTIHGDDHMKYESCFGIPVMLARLEDRIFEGLPNAIAKEWPARFMEAITPGADLSTVGWKFQYWLLTDKTVNPGIEHEIVRDAVKTVAEVLLPLTEGQPVNIEAAESAWSAARSAAESAAESAAWSAWSAAESARSDAYVRMADKLIELLKAAPVVTN